MTGAQLDSMGMGARGMEHTTRDESGGPEVQISSGEESVFGSNAEECAASGAGSIHPSSEGTICSRTSPELSQVRYYEYYPIADLGHARRDRSVLLTWVRILRRSSLRGCRQCSLGFQTWPDGQGRSYRSAPDGQVNWPAVRSRRTRRSVRGEKSHPGQRG